jgi:hypothetical protein
VTDSVDPSLPAALGRLSTVLAGFGVTDFAVSGGVAVGVWASPRTTRDIDLCGSLPPDSLDAKLSVLDGMRFGPQSLPDSIRFALGPWDVDFFVAKSDYDRACLSRALPVEMLGATLRVVTAEDLLIHKLMKLRTDRRRILQDLADLRAVIVARAHELDHEYLRAWLSPSDAELLAAISDLDDEDLVKRILAR